VKVMAEVVVEITDEAALERRALADIEAAVISVGQGVNVEEVRAFEREAVTGDPVAAVERLADPGALVDDRPGVEFVEGMHEVVEVDERGLPLSVWPRFAELFPLCECGKESCEACNGYQVTPRTAAALWTVGQILASRAFDDVLEHGDEPVGDEGMWSLFDEYPRITMGRTRCGDVRPRVLLTIWLQIWRRVTGRSRGVLVRRWCCT
jgi:hypothetical protein